MNNISEKIAEKIKKGEVKMRPRFQFVFKSILIALGIFVILGTALYLISFILFVVQRSGLIFLPRYGFGGIRILLNGFPWLLLLIVICFIFLLEFLLKKYTIAYRKPLLYSSLIIILIILGMGFVIHQTSFHGQMYLRSQEGKIPLARSLYNKFELLNSNKVHPGIITEVLDDGFILERHDGELLKVIISEEFNIKEDLHVAVIGDLKDGIVKAIGVHNIPNGKRFPNRPRFKKPF